MSERSFAEALYHPAAGVLEAARHGEDAADRRRLRLRARRRLRAGARLRHDRRLRDGQASASRRSTSGSSPAAAAPSAWRGCSASSGRWSYVLTGRRFDAETARELGLVNRVVEGWRLARGGAGAGPQVAEQPPIAARLAKQAVLAAEETAISAGLESERRLYELAMATEDRVEGMKAFLEKREPEFEGDDADGRVAKVARHRRRRRRARWGRGIAQIACLGGYETRLHDPDSRRARGRDASGCARRWRRAPSAAGGARTTPRRRAAA